MAFSYLGDVELSEKDKVRFYCGDTESGEHYLEDEEIGFILSEQSDVLRASLIAAETIYARLAKRADKRNGDWSSSQSQKFEQYGKVIERLKNKIALTGAVPYAGGISVSDKTTRENLSDRVTPSFTRTLHDPESIALNSSLSE